MKLLSRLAWLSFGAMLALYAVMVMITLPRIAAEANGLLPFDLRPLGYSVDEAKAFLGALSPAGKDVYQSIQHKLDIFYPLLLTVTLFLAIVLTAPPSWRRVRWVAAAVALPALAFDWLENAAVGRMLATTADTLPAELAEAASRWTVLKSATGAIAMTLALLLVIGWLYRRIAGRAH